MNESEKKMLFDFIHSKRYGVEATVHAGMAPQAALVAIAVTADLEIILDTEKTSRKYRNILANPNVALVIGWENETTMQLEGVGREIQQEDLPFYKKIYFEQFPDGKERKKWSQIVYIAVKPHWIRFSDFTNVSPIIREWILPVS